MSGLADFSPRGVWLTLRLPALTPNIDLEISGESVVNCSEQRLAELVVVSSVFVCVPELPRGGVDCCQVENTKKIVKMSNGSTHGSPIEICGYETFSSQTDSQLH